MLATRPTVAPWTRHLAIALTLCLVGCNSGTGNPAGPTTARQNLPALANAPQNPGDLATVKRVKVTGKVVDGITGEPLEKVKVFLISEISAQPPALPKATPPPAAGSDMVPAPGSAAGASPAPITPGQLPGPDGAPNPAASPPPAEVKVETFTTTTNNEGKFFFNGIPEGSFTVSFAAPKYRVLTLGNVDAAKLDDVRLLGRSDQPRKSVKGSVLSASGQPVAGALVSPIFHPGQGFATFVPTDEQGQFLIDELTSLPKGFAALSQGAGGQIVAFSLLAPPDEAKKDEKGWLDGLFKGKSTDAATAKKDEPVKLTVKALTETVGLTATIDAEGAAADYEPTEAAVFMAVNDKGDEALVYRSRITGNTVKATLPPLTGNSSYHLRVRAVGPEGASSYHHRYKLQGDDKDLKIRFLPAPTRADVTLGKDGPTFHWDAVVGADAYRVQVERPNGDMLWQGWTTKSSLAFPNEKGFEALNPKDTLLWTVSAVKGVQGGKVNPSLLTEAAWSDLSMTAALDLDLTGNAKKKKLIAGPSPKPVTPAKPSASPKPAASAAKPPAVEDDRPAGEPPLEPLVPDEIRDLPAPEII